MTLHKNDLYEHAERPERVKSIHKFNLLRGIFQKYNWLEIKKCDSDYLKLLHSESYLQRHQNILNKINKYYKVIEKKKQINKQNSKNKQLNKESNNIDDLNNMMKDLKISNDISLTEDERKLVKLFPEDIHINFGEDNFENKDTLEAAILSASGVKTGLDYMFPNKYNKIKELNKVFCNIRPPGHHSLGNSKCQASGFCFFNNIALGAKSVSYTHLTLPTISRV